MIWSRHLSVQVEVYRVLVDLEQAVLARGRAALEAAEEVVEHRVQSEVVFLVQAREVRRNEAVLAQKVRLGQVEPAQERVLLLAVHHPEALELLHQRDDLLSRQMPVLARQVADAVRCG